MSPPPLPILLLLGMVACAATARSACARPGDPPQPLAHLIAPDAAQGDEAGRAIAAAGRRILVGAPSGNPNGVVNQGSAWVYRLEPDGSWVPESRLLDPSGAADHEFGFSVAIDDLGDGQLVAAIGAWRKPNGAIVGAGGASIFRFANGRWMHEANIAANDPSANAEFGRSIAVRGDTVLVGAWRAGLSSHGAAYVFRRQASGAWTQTQKLVPPGNAFGDQHGTTMALDSMGDRAIIGAWGDDAAATNGGAATTWTRNAAGSFVYEAQLVGADVAASDELGRGVAIDGDLAVVGSWPFFGDGIGKAYVFRRIGNAWIEEAKLTAPDGLTDDYFGFSVAVERGDDALGLGDRIACGAWADDIAGVTNQGSVWLFERTSAKANGGWSATAQLTAADGEASDYFGFSLAWLCDLLAVGVRFDDTNGTLTTGSARVWWAADPDDDGRPDACAQAAMAADLDGDGLVNASDLAILLDGWGGSGAADLDGDGTVGAADLAMLLDAWG
ncbi:MAG: hypothetical protein RLZZ238_2797 [Planctomycetota bacterium]